MRIALITSAVACGLLANTALACAQSPEPRKAQHIDDLLALGFEIKAAIPSRTGSRLILQKGSAIYNCDGYKLGTDVPAATPKAGVGIDRTLCFAVKFR
jgi:hypothetical protein